MLEHYELCNFHINTRTIHCLLGKRHEHTGNVHVICESSVPPQFQNVYNHGRKSSVGQQHKLEQRVHDELLSAAFQVRQLLSRLSSSCPRPFRTKLLLWCPIFTAVRCGILLSRQQDAALVSRSCSYFQFQPTNQYFHLDNKSHQQLSHLYQPSEWFLLVLLSKRALGFIWTIFFERRSQEPTRYPVNSP